MGTRDCLQSLENSIEDKMGARDSLQSLQNNIDDKKDLARQMQTISSIVQDRLTYNVADILNSYAELVTTEAQELGQWARPLYFHLGLQNMSIKVHGYENLHVARKIAKIFSGQYASYKDEFFSIDIEPSSPDGPELFEVSYKVDAVLNLNIIVVDVRKNIPKDILSEDCEVVEEKYSFNSYKTIVCPT